jgi:sugar lactone lactonase YvrE
MHCRSFIPVCVLALAAPSAWCAEPIFDPAAGLKVEATGGAGGEGPAWDPRLGLLTSGNGHIYQLTRDGRSRVYRRDAGTNGLLFDRQGRLLACEPAARRITRTEPDGSVTVLTDRYEGHRYNEPNDLTVDSRGRVYFSDPRYGPHAGRDILDEKGRTIEGVYRIDPDGTVRRVLGREVERANGVLVSADDRFLYVADNNNNAVGGARKLWRFDLGKDGSVDAASKRLVYDWGKGRGPDGVKQDREGRLYVAAGLNRPNPPHEPAADVKGGVYVLSPGGKLLTFLPVPKDEVTNCAFGGDDLRTLYITAGGTIYSTRTTPGRVVWPADRPNFRPPKDEADLRYWLENMVWYHHFTVDEVRAATGLGADEVAGALKKSDIRVATRPRRAAGAPLLVLPYPGGRHPRAGFLEGAVRPQRETKVSVFTPWDEDSYVVADVPEALWSNLGLIYLAHTHVPTVWERQGVELERLEWNRRADGTLDVERRLPNGVCFGAKVVPGRDLVRMELWLSNGTRERLTGLRVQNCVLLKAAAGFGRQTDENKVYASPYAACRSEDGKRWVVTAWEPCDRCWGNARCPCLHSDPKFPDCAPGETRRLRGVLSFYEGEDVRREFRRLEKAGWRGGAE